MKTQRDFRNYLAGAALAFGLVLLTVQIMFIILSGMSDAEILAYDSLLWNVIYIANLAGGGLGSFLVARYKQTDYIQIGTIVSVLAYIFEIVYNFIVGPIPNNIWSCASLILGGIMGSMFFKAKMERERIDGLKKTGEPKPATESGDKPQP